MSIKLKALPDKTLEEDRAKNFLIDESEFYDQNEFNSSWELQSINYLKRKFSSLKEGSYLGLFEHREKKIPIRQRIVSELAKNPAETQELRNPDYETFIKKNKYIEQRRSFFVHSFKDSLKSAPTKNKVIIYPKKLVKKKVTLLHRQQFDLVHVDEESSKNCEPKAVEAQAFPSPALSTYKKIFRGKNKSLGYLKKRVDRSRNKASFGEEKSPDHTSNLLYSVVERSTFLSRNSEKPAYAHLPIFSKKRRGRYRPFIPEKRTSNPSEKKQLSSKAILLRSTSDIKRSSGIYNIFKHDLPPRQFNEKVRNIHQLGRRTGINFH